MDDEIHRTGAPTRAVGTRNPSDGGMSEAVRAHLGAELKSVYASMLAEEQPATLLDLIAKLRGGSAASASAAAFRTDLLAALPGLRAFALSLAINPATADDLVQETLLKAWQSQNRFEPGSNLKAWLCTILRNQFYTECRKRKREVEDADGAMAAKVVAPAAQEASSDLRRVWQHLGKLPASQREALVLVAAQGMTYEAAAQLIGCQVGTVKSRVSRARSFLAGSFGMESARVATSGGPILRSDPGSVIACDVVSGPRVERGFDLPGLTVRSAVEPVTVSDADPERRVG